MKPFTMIAALLLLAVAALHAYRIYSGMDVMLGAYALPMWASWAGAVVTGFLGLMLFVESRK